MLPHLCKNDTHLASLFSNRWAIQLKPSFCLTAKQGIRPHEECAAPKERTANRLIAYTSLTFLINLSPVGDCLSGCSHSEDPQVGLPQLPGQLLTNQIDGNHARKKSIEMQRHTDSPSASRSFASSSILWNHLSLLLLLLITA